MHSHGRDCRCAVLPSASDRAGSASESSAVRPQPALRPPLPTVAFQSERQKQHRFLPVWCLRISRDIAHRRSFFSRSIPQKSLRCKIPAADILRSAALGKCHAAEYVKERQRQRSGSISAPGVPCSGKCLRAVTFRQRNSRQQRRSGNSGVPTTAAFRQQRSDSGSPGAACGKPRFALGDSPCAARFRSGSAPFSCNSGRMLHADGISPPSGGGSVPLFLCQFRFFPSPGIVGYFTKRIDAAGRACYNNRKKKR